MNRQVFLVVSFISFLMSSVCAQDSDGPKLVQSSTSTRTSDAELTAVERSLPAPSPVSPTVGSSSTRKIPKAAGEREGFEFDTRPHLLFLSSLHLNGGGYTPVSGTFGGGFSFEPKHLVIEGLATYDNGRKTNDGTLNNLKGHTRELRAGLFYRLPSYWFFGTDGTWVQLSTTNYKKQMWNTSFGGGRDFSIFSTTTRMKFTYTLPYFDHSNGLQGLNIHIYIPSPLHQGRVTFYEQVGIFRVHDTITAPNDPVTTARELASRHFTSSASFGLRVRF